MSEYELVLKVTNIVHLPGAIHLADFNTHVFGAAAFVSLGATSATKLLSLSLTEGITLMAAGLIGGILPDIDLPASTPSKALLPGKRFTKLAYRRLSHCRLYLPSCAG